MRWWGWDRVLFPGPQGSSLCVSPHGHLLTPPGGGFWGKREELLPAPNALKMGLPPPTPHHSSLFCPLSQKKEVPLRIVVTGIVCVCVCVCVYDSAPFYVICVLNIFMCSCCAFSQKPAFRVCKCGDLYLAVIPRGICIPEEQVFLFLRNLLGHQHAFSLACPPLFTIALHLRQRIGH